MSRATKVIVGLIAALVLGGWPARAQIVVFDPAVTLRNGVTAAVEQLMFEIQQTLRDQMRNMAQRLSVFSSLDPYALADNPEWRIHEFLDASAVRYARDYHAALNYGDGSGRAYLGVIEPLLAVDDEGELGGLSPDVWREFTARLATVNVADATTIAATNDDGVLRYSGRSEQAAIEALQQQVIDPAQEQSTTAVLDKISGAVLIGARSRQARIQLLTAFVEQLLVDTKRARDTDATAINMQLTTWRDAAAANAALAAGTGDALRTWRQP
jgi:hypothetical protein